MISKKDCYKIIGHDYVWGLIVFKLGVLRCLYCNKIKPGMVPKGWKKLHVNW